MKHNPRADFADRFRRVLIVEDHPLYAEALRGALSLCCAGSDVLLSESLADALGRIAGGLAPDLVLFDLRLPDSDGIEGFRRIRDAAPGAAILVVSAAASRATIEDLIEAGAAGFMPKEDSADTLRRAIVEMAGGRVFTSDPPREKDRAESLEAARCEARARVLALTPQQRRILAMICDGKPNKQIAYEMSLAEASVKAHITALLRRLGVQNRTQAALLAGSAGMAAEDGPAS